MTRNDYLAKQELPLIPGGEVAGRTPDGRRVAALVASGGYAEKVAVHEAVLVPVPDQVSDEEAAALLLQGLTARTLLRTSARLEEGESVVVQAAAGGTGSLAVQLAKRMGAGRVIGLASSEQKRELARRLGADAAVDSRADDLEAAILEANDGEPVDVVLEMSGGKSFEACLRALAPFGRLVTYGLASREPVEVRQRRPDANQPLRRGLLAHAPLRPPAGASRGDRRAARGRRREGARGRDRRDLPALGGAPRARGHRRAANARQAAPRPES